MTLINNRDKIEEQELTFNPIFLVQRRHLVLDQCAIDTLNNEYEVIDGDVYDKDAYQKAKHKPNQGDDDLMEQLEPMAEDDLYAEGYGEWTWETKYVAYTREEGEAISNKWGNDGRTWCVPATGSLVKILKGQLS